ncbi:MAG: hypothetical protein ACXVUX_11945 [Solirubrobacteraceae bacterium]
MNPPALVAFSRVREDGVVAIGSLLLGAAALVAVHFLLLHTYWDYSEGVYALTAHEILHGGDLYGQIVGAQPPGVFVAGVTLLAIHDSVEWLRFGVACLQLGAGLIAARIVYRVTASRIATALTPAAILLTPWAVHEHGALTPELVALPVMLGAGLLAADRRRAGWAGALCGLLVLIKLPLAIPAAVLIWVSGDRRRAAVAAAIVLIAGLAAAWIVGGSGFWRDVVIAQLHSGSRGLGALGGFWAQAGWNVVGLLVCAGAAVVLRARAREPRLLTISIALAAANLVTFLTNFKEGTGLNITVPVEASLVPLAACGVVFALRVARERPAPAARWAAAACLLALAFTLAQTISLLAVAPKPIPFLRAFSAPAWGVTLTAPQFDASVDAARACPPGEAYAGPPLVALAAGRTPPAGQPDSFLPTHSSTLAAVGAQIAATQPVCPPLISSP